MVFFQQFLIMTWDLLCNYSLLDTAEAKWIYITQSGRYLKDENTAFATKGRYHRHERCHDSSKRWWAPTLRNKSKECLPSIHIVRNELTENEVWTSLNFESSRSFRVISAMPYCFLLKLARKKKRPFPQSWSSEQNRGGAAIHGGRRTLWERQRK